MMKMIRPIVNVSKVLDDFDTIIVGFRGTLTDGASVKSEALNALVNMKKSGKRIILLTNSSQRVVSIASFLQRSGVPLAIFESIISVGEILHYKLKAENGEYKGLGTNYYQIGREDGVFNGLDYQKVEQPEHADFLYVNGVNKFDDTINTYLPLLEHAASLSIPFLCVGNEKSTYMNGEVVLSPAALAEQYALLGGKVLSIGKPDIKIMSYCLDGLENVSKSKTILIGDNITTDIKGACLLGISSILISKGVHVNFLGEGYIPDVAKTRELSNNFNISPDFIISNLRW